MIADVVPRPIAGGTVARGLLDANSGCGMDTTEMGHAVQFRFSIHGVLAEVISHSFPHNRPFAPKPSARVPEGEHVLRARPEGNDAI